MSKRFVLGSVLTAAIAIASSARAHEGHLHKVMGTVSMRHENHLEVKVTDGKTSLVTLNDRTKILRGKAKVPADDIKPGERIVLTVKETKGKDGKSSMVATEIRLGTASTTTSSK